MNEPLPKEETVTVCASCLRASCWQGEFYCEDYKSAGTVEKTIDELLALDLEHWSHFHADITLMSTSPPTSTTALPS